MNYQPGPVFDGVAYSMKPLHRDSQGDENGGGEGGVVHAVEDG